MNDEMYMRRCFELAERGLGAVAPNPLVGAVLVHEGVVIGEGYHMKFGEAHAEVNCIQSVKKEHENLISKSKLFVSLEPCSHFGKTPPCTNLILQHEIPEVIIACKDPFEKVLGTGIAQLQAAGVKVVVGLLEKEAIELNKRFFCFHQKKRPFIILKWAQTSNQMIAHANGTPLKISNATTDKKVHQWRSEESSIMVGAKTILSDNPSLTTRFWKGENPTRIIIDKNLKISKQKKVFDDEAPTLVFNFLEEKKAGSNHFLKISPEKNSINQILLRLQEMQIQSVLVEGGAQLIQSFLNEDVWDEARIITNTKLFLEDGLSAPVFKNGQLVKETSIEEDLIQYYYH